MLMNRKRAHLVVIDVQERLAPHIAGNAEVVGNCVRLIAYARRLGVPVTLTEHFPQGLGPTAPPVLEAAGNEACVLAKTSFSCWRDAAIRGRIEELAAEGRDQLVIAGMEAHVCVGQTVLDIAAAHRPVFLVADGVGSRLASVRDLAVERMRAAGTHIVAQEMVAFEWLEQGDHPAFRDLLALIK